MADSTIDWENENNSNRVGAGIHDAVEGGSAAGGAGFVGGCVITAAVGCVEGATIIGSLGVMGGGIGGGVYGLVTGYSGDIPFSDFLEQIREAGG